MINTVKRIAELIFLTPEHIKFALNFAASTHDFQVAFVLKKVTSSSSFLHRNKAIKISSIKKKHQETHF